MQALQTGTNRGNVVQVRAHAADGLPPLEMALSVSSMLQSGLAGLPLGSTHLHGIFASSWTASCSYMAAWANAGVVRRAATHEDTQCKPCLRQEGGLCRRAMYLLPFPIGL